MCGAVAVAESTEVQLLQVHAFVADADVADVVDVADITGAPMGFTSLMSLISLMLPKEMHPATEAEVADVALKCCCCMLRCR